MELPAVCRIRVAGPGDGNDCAAGGVATPPAGVCYSLSTFVPPTPFGIALRASNTYFASFATMP